MERRLSPRVPLDAPCLLTMVLNYSETLQAMVVDVSQGGVQLALSPGVPQENMQPGTPVTLQNVPAPLDRIIEGVHGKIAWVGVRCCGVRLNKPLSIAPADVADLSRL